MIVECEAVEIEDEREGREGEIERRWGVLRESRASLEVEGLLDRVEEGVAFGEEEVEVEI